MLLPGNSKSAIMLQQLNPYRTLSIAMFVCGLISSCKKDAVVDATPAAYILGSEQKYVADAVDLPIDVRYSGTRVATYYAIGVQQYRAKEIAGNGAVKYEWTFVAPRADLYDVTNAKVGTHGAGPFWRTTKGDEIFAQHFTPAKTAPGDDANSIDLLLLMPKQGSTPTGIFAGVTYIQRLATKGGKAPATPPTHADQTVEVKYEAVYRFTKKNPTLN